RKTLSTPVLSLEIIEKVVDEVVGEPIVDEDTEKLYLLREEMKDLNTLALLAKGWASKARYYQSRALLATRPDERRWHGLQDLLKGQVESTFAGSVDCFFFDMWRRSGIRVVETAAFTSL
ncbi:hypothetical protein MPER_02403, partial [Moniliophthora perniciosa FA553]